MKDLSGKLPNEAQSQSSTLGDGCFSSHEYNMLSNNKGKQKAYVNGWHASENGLPTSVCPYKPKVNYLIPSCPYYKAWHCGYESFINER